MGICGIFKPNGYLEKFFEFLFTTPQETINKAVADHEKLRKHMMF